MDQPAPDLELYAADPLRLFEVDFPFSRTHILAFEERLNESTTEPEGSIVSLDTMKEKFQTEAWSEL